MDFDDYQSLAKTTAVYPRKHKVTYPMLGLAGEVGELLNKYKKTLRGDIKGISKEDALGELGDILWYVSAICTDLDLRMMEVAGKNIDKLLKRKVEDKIKGSGDNR